MADAKNTLESKKRWIKMAFEGGQSYSFFLLGLFGSTVPNAIKNILIY